MYILRIDINLYIEYNQKLKMDRQLLDALSNIGAALEQLTEALNERSSMKSDVGQAMQGGDFGKQLEEISVGIKSIKDDTKKILDNQQTIIQLQKEQSSSDTKVFEEAGGGKTKQMIKDGVAVIALIAGAVLAIGLAFSIIGTVDFLSVIAISAAIPLIAIAFEKVASIEGLTPEKVFVTGLALVGMSIAIAASSIILQTVQPIGIFQALTIVFIGVAFGAAAYGIGQLIKGFEGINPAQALLASMILPIILIATSVAISASSVILQKVQPIGLFQALTVVLIAAAFGVAAFGLGKLIRSFEGINPAVALAAAALMPLVLVGLSLAITESSKILQDVQVIGLFQAISAIFIAGVLVVLSYAVKPLMQGVKGIDFLDIIKGGLVILGLVSVLTMSSMILQDYQLVDLSTLFNLAIMSIAVSVSVLAIGFVAKKLNDFGTVGDFIKGGLSIIILSAVIAGSSHILSLGKYSEGSYPSLGWSLGVGLSLVAFGLSTFALGLVVSSGAGAVVMLAGAAAILGVAGVIVGVSKILPNGDYSDGSYPSLGWSLGVGTSIVAFGLSSIALGAVILTGLGAAALITGLWGVNKLANGLVELADILRVADFSGGPTKEWSEGVVTSLIPFSNMVMKLGSPTFGKLLSIIPGIDSPIESGRKFISDIAQTMVNVSNTLQGGSWVGGPTEEWSSGVALALGAFSSVYSMLVQNKSILSLVGLGGVTPDEFTDAIKTISEGILTASISLSGVNFESAPGLRDWADGVGKAIGAFSPVYEVLAKNSGWLKSGVSVGDMKKAILTISEGIVDAADFFSKNDVKFEGGPSSSWSDGVAKAIGAFSPIYEILGGKSVFKSDTAFINSIRNGVVMLASSITSASIILSRGKFDKYPQKEYIDGVIYALKKFSTIVSLARGLDSGPGLLAKGFAAITGGVAESPLDKAVSNIEKLATAFEKMGSAFKNLSGSIDEIDAGKLDMIRSMSSNVVMLSLMDPTQFNNMMDALEERGGIFADLMKDFEEKKAQSPTVTTGGGVSVGVEKSKSDIEVLGGKMDSMIAILGDMSQVMGSGGTLNTYLNSIKENQLDGDRHRSDIRLKNIISNLGKSSLGINIYTFEYKFNPGIVYQGVIAQELLGTEFEMALVKDKSGFYSVDYSVIDVIFKKVETIS
jgi:hypothetical protein